MTREIANRIAANLIKQFGHEGHFALSLPTRSNLQLLAESLSEKHGCRVVWNEQANKIAVLYPGELVAVAKGA